MGLGLYYAKMCSFKRHFIEQNSMQEVCFCMRFCSVSSCRFCPQNWSSVLESQPLEPSLCHCTGERVNFALKPLFFRAMNTVYCIEGYVAFASERCFFMLKQTNRNRSAHTHWLAGRAQQWPPPTTGIPVWWRAARPGQGGRSADRQSGPRLPSGYMPASCQTALEGPENELCHFFCTSQNSLIGSAWRVRLSLNSSEWLCNTKPRSTSLSDISRHCCPLCTVKLTSGPSAFPTLVLEWKYLNGA